jgi:hypothetical protein
MNCTDSLIVSLNTRNSHRDRNFGGVYPILKYLILNERARSGVVVKALCYKPVGRGFEIRRGECSFLIYLILPASLGPGVYSAFNRKIISRGGRERPVRRADNLTVICEPIA